MQARANTSRPLKIPIKALVHRFRNHQLKGFQVALHASSLQSIQVRDAPLGIRFDDRRWIALAHQDQIHQEPRYAAVSVQSKSVT